MHWLYSVVRFLPYWGLPTILLSAELGWYYHRKRQNKRFLFWFASGLVSVFFILWIWKRGDLNSDLWVRDWLSE